MIDFVIAGTFKSASSTLSYELARHPEIDIPKPKDPYFYLAELCRGLTGPAGFMEEHDLHSVYDRACFEALFTKQGPRVLKGEATPLYLYCHGQAIPSLKADNSDTRIIILLRNPADRAYSNYKHNVKDGYESRSFTDCIADWQSREQLPLHPFFHYVRAGLYDEQVEAWQAAFKHVLVVSYDDVDTRPYDVLNQVADFLGIAPSFAPKEAIRLNMSGQPRVHWLHNFIRHENTVKSFLRPVYRALISDNVRRKAISEKVKNLNIKSGEMPPADRIALMEIYADDLARLSRRPGCGFVAKWLT